MPPLFVLLALQSQMCQGLVPVKQHNQGAFLLHYIMAGFTSFFHCFWTVLHGPLGMSWSSGSFRAKREKPNSKTSRNKENAGHVALGLLWNACSYLYFVSERLWMIFLMLGLMFFPLYYPYSPVFEHLTLSTTSFLLKTAPTLLSVTLRSPLFFPCPWLNILLCCPLCPAIHHTNLAFPKGPCCKPTFNNK